MLVLAPYFLQIFGSHYVTEGTTTLRVLALATVAAAFNYWSAIGSGSPDVKAMVGVQVVSTAVMIGLAVALVHLGPEWVAASWGAGHLVGGVLGFVVTRTIAKVSDDAPGTVAAKPLEGAR